MASDRVVPRFIEDLHVSEEKDRFRPTGPLLFDERAERGRRDADLLTQAEKAKQRRVSAHERWDRVHSRVMAGSLIPLDKVTFADGIVDDLSEETSQTDRIRLYIELPRLSQELQDLMFRDQITELYNLGDLGQYNPDALEWFIKNHRRVVKHARLLQALADTMDGWIAGGMPAVKGSKLENYLVERGKNSNLRERSDPSISDAQKGRIVVKRAWLAFRGDVTRAIRIGSDPELVGFGRWTVLTGGYAVNWPYLSPGYTIHPEVVENMPSLTLLEIMIHEPMHDWERFGWDIGHNDASGLDEQIGWSIRGWPLGVQQVLIWVYNILVRMPPTGPKTGGMNNRWDECLREAGLQ